MASSIDATKPTAGAALTADVRNNFSAAKTEIEALQADLTAAWPPSSTSPAAHWRLAQDGRRLGALPVPTWTPTPATTNACLLGGRPTPQDQRRGCRHGNPAAYRAADGWWKYWSENGGPRWLSFTCWGLVALSWTR